VEKRRGTMEYRRRVTRQPTAWAGFCHIDGEPLARWRDCEVIDISMFGLGVSFHHPEPWNLVTRRILVDISAIGEAVNIRLEGEIRNADFTLEGDIRVGVELVGLSESEQAITAVLSGINRIEARQAGRSST
jgi:hypothetical protein